MPILKINITNPEALELIRKIQSREIFIPFVAWFKKYKWFIISPLVLIALITALAIGKKLSGKTPVPTFTPPDIESLVPTSETTTTSETTVKSDFFGIKEEIQKLNTDLPDPYLPVFDNAIDLEVKAI